MSEHFKQFFASTCQEMVEKHLFEQADEVTFTEIRLDLADYARLTGVKITMEAGNRELIFKTNKQDVEFQFTYKW